MSFLDEKFTAERNVPRRSPLAESSDEYRAIVLITLYLV